MSPCRSNVMAPSQEGPVAGSSCRQRCPFPNGFVLLCLFFGEASCPLSRPREAAGPAPLGEPAALGLRFRAAEHRPASGF